MEALMALVNMGERVPMGMADMEAKVLLVRVE